MFLKSDTMGILDKIRGKKEEEKKEEAKPEIEINPKYANRICAGCEQPGADKKWAGQTWHKKCLRKMRKMAKGMM